MITLVNWGRLQVATCLPLFDPDRADSRFLDAFLESSAAEKIGLSAGTQQFLRPIHGSSGYV
jgi:hypothetical protein